MNNINELVGKTITKIEITDDDYDGEMIRITCSDNTVWLMNHYQSCCENVYLVDVTLQDLECLYNTPILDAYESSNNDNPIHEDVDLNPYYQWTFYILRTMYDTVTIRWYGHSNGYYSVSVDFNQVKN